jgi:hypothetical protein
MPVGGRHRTFRTLTSGAAVFAAAAALTVGPTTAARAAEPDFTIELGPGVACTGFALRIEGTGDKRMMREFTDADGRVVRTLSAGKGFSLTFTNVKTGARVSLRPSGSVSWTRLNADGTATVASTGHNVVIFFPADEPAGPSTTLYVGRIVYTVDAEGVFTLRSVSGRTTDICALLR